MKPLGGELGDAVDVERVDRMTLVDRPGGVRLAVELAGRRVDDGRARASLANPFQEGELAARVEVEVAKRIRHRVDVRNLAGQVEDVVGGADLSACHALVRDIADD